MGFQDLPLIAGQAGKTVSGLGLSQTAPLTLEVAAGSVKIHRTGDDHVLGTAQSHTFSPDATYPTRVFMGLISDGVTTDLWVDEYVDDGTKVQGNPPSGYSLVLEFAWFSIPANETDLANVGLNRRTWE